MVLSVLLKVDDMKDSGIIEIGLGLGTAALMAVAGLGGLSVVTGCTPQYSEMTPDAVLSAEGIRALNDGYIGMLKTATEDNTKNSYLEHRKAEDVELSKRNEDGKSFLQRISTRFRKAMAEQGGK